MNRKLPEIEQAYRNTTYHVDDPDGSFAIRVGERAPRLERLLAAHGTTAWAYVTAWNPGSEKMSIENNGLRNAALRELLERDGYVIYPGRGEADAGNWVAEESYLVLGMTAAVAQQIGARFGQHAVLAGQAGGCAELVWCGS